MELDRWRLLPGCDVPLLAKLPSFASLPDLLDFLFGSKENEVEPIRFEALFFTLLKRSLFLKKFDLVF